ncbi:uncharacterized protein LOC143240526 isoform X6 [Tachypleus tridentatus]|uniref:uncharacterized protein LOC143240526 isoform X6 n=1 Tax=Tachypleus tridentatus TaxID=6853 RepID=UPI003FD16BF0
MDQKAKVFQKVSEALKLDGEKQYEVAYRKYLESVNSLSAYLLEDLSKNGVPQGEGKTRDTKKIFSLSKECLGRMEVLLEKLCTDSQSDTLDDQKLCDSNVEKPKFGIQTLFTEGSSGSIDKACGHESEAFTSVSGVQNSATFQLESHEMSGFVLPTTWPRKKMTPLEKSQKENLLLRKVFQSRMARAADSRTKVNLHLELERRLAENMMVARRKQIMFLKDQERKEKKALARATKKLPSEEEKKQQLYAKILRIEETEDWPSNLWKKLEEAPEDSDVIEQIAMTILRLAYSEAEQRIARSISQQKENCPEDMGIPSSFFEKNLTFYQEIILKIVKIIDIKSPLSKLQLLVTVIQQICGTTDFSKDCHSSLIQPLSADELLPVVSYILIKTDLPQLFSECQLLDQLMDQRYLMGEEGYCLTSFLTALKYLETQMDW